MKRIITLLILIAPFVGFSQSIVNQGTPTTLIKMRGGLAADSIFSVPIRDTTQWMSSWGNLTIRPQDNNLYFRSGGSWKLLASEEYAIQDLSSVKTGDSVTINISGGGSPTTFSIQDGDASPTNELQNITRSGQNINLSLGGGSVVDSNHKYSAGTNISITGSYPNFTVNASGIDTTSLSNRINTKQFYSDTLTYDATKQNLKDTATVLRALVKTTDSLNIKQGGNSFGLPMSIGTNDLQPIQFRVNGNNNVAGISPAGNFYASGVYNPTSANNSWVQTSAGGTVISRNVTDANAALIVNNQLGTGDIFRVHQAGAGRFIVNNTGTTYTTANAFVGGNITTNTTSILPTHSLTIPSVGTGIAQYNTADQTTNYERVRQYWSGNVFNIASERGGTGSNRNLIYSGFPNVTYTGTITLKNAPPTSTGYRQLVWDNVDSTIKSIAPVDLTGYLQYSDTLTMIATKADIVEASGGTIQSLSNTKSGNNIALGISGGGAGTNFSVADADSSITNEIQTLDRTGNTITLSNGGGSVIDSFANYTAGTNMTRTGTYPNYTFNASVPAGYIQYSDTNTVISTKKNLVDTSSTLRGLINGKEDAFSKGSLIQGTNAILTGTLTNRLVGSGNVTIDANLSSAIKYTDTLTRIATRSYVDTAKANIRAEKENVFSKGSIVAGSNVTISGTLTNRLVGAGNVTINASTIDTTSLSNRINTKINLSEKAQPNGVATLGADGKVPTSQLPDAILGAVIYQGTYSVVTNTPTLPTATGNKGKYYVVTDSGLYIPNSTVYRQGDWIISNGVIWQKVDNNNNVTSVNGQVGNVTINTTSDLSLGTRTSTTLPINNSNGTGVTLPAATTTLSGLLTASDKIKLDGLSVPNNGTLTLNTTGISSGSASFTANQSGNSTFTVNTPGTNVGANLTGSTLNITSTTGTGASVNLSSLTPTTPSLQAVRDVGKYITVYAHGVGESAVVFGEAIGNTSMSFYPTAANNWAWQTFDGGGGFGGNIQLQPSGFGQAFYKGNEIATINQLHNPITIGTANGLSLSTQVLSLAAANTSTTGALTSTDWNTFNNKQTALSGTGVLSFSGTTPSYSAGTANQILRRNAANTAYEFFTPTWTSNTGTVTNFSAGTLSPLFTTSVATSTTTPALTFALTAAAANTWFGNATGSSTTPSYNSLGALTKTDDANVTLTLGGTPATALAKPVSMTLGWSGQLSVARGGTGVGTLTGVAIGNGTSSFTGVTGTAGQLLRRNAANTAYEFFTPTFLTSETDPVFETNALRQPLKWRAVMNSIGFNNLDTIYTAGVYTCPWGGDWDAYVANKPLGALTGSNVRSLLEVYNENQAGNLVVVQKLSLSTDGTSQIWQRSLTHTGAWGSWVNLGGTAYTGSTSITLTSGSFARAALTGDVTAASNSNTTTIANNAVTYAKMQDIPTNSLIGRSASGTGDPSAITVGSGLRLESGTLAANQFTITPSLDFPAISGVGATTYLDVSISGAEVGDVVTLGLPIDAGESVLTFKAYVIGSGTVRLRAMSLTNTAIDLPPLVYTLKLIK